MHKRTKHKQHKTQRRFVARHTIKRNVPYVLFPPDPVTGKIGYREATQDEIAMFKAKFPQLRDKDKPA